MDADFHQNLSSCGNFEKDFFHKFFISIQLYSEYSVQYYTFGLNGVLMKTDIAKDDSDDDDNMSIMMMRMIMLLTYFVTE